MVTNCIFRNLGHGIGFGGNPGIADFDALTVEQCGAGICMQMPITWYDDNTDTAQAPGRSSGNSYFNNITIRNCSSYAFGGELGGSVVQNMNIISDGAIGIPNHGLRAIVNNIYRNINISGLFTGAALNLTNSTGGNTFENVSATCSGGGGVPVSGITWERGYGRNANVFRNCSGFTFAQTLHELPVDQSKPYSSVLVTDSIDPAWTGSVSNAGKPLGLIFATSAGSAAGGFQLFFPAGLLPGSIAYPTPVANVSNPASIPVGSVVEYVNPDTGAVNVKKKGEGGTEPYVSFPLAIASGDKIVFAVGGGMNNVLALWNGFYWQMVG
jgi:hypothetical protein